MKNAISLFLSLILLEVCARPAVGRGPALTEAEALTEAKAHSPEVRRLDAAAHEASWRRLEALSDYLPHVFVGAQHLLWEQYAVAEVRFGPINATVPAPVPQTVLNLDASLVLFDGLRALNTYRAAVLNHDAADHELSRTIFRLEHEVRLRTVEKSQEAVRLATLGLKAGTTTHAEILDAELDLFRARAGVVRAQMDAAEALLNLELALGQRPASQQ